MFAKKNLALLVIGLLSLGAYFWATKVESRAPRLFSYAILAQVVLFLCAAWLIVRGRTHRATLGIVVAFAVLFRLSVLFSAPQLSTDVYRYIWDGRVQAAGINPYRYIPNAPQLVNLRDTKIYPHINRSDYAPTMYPPAAEAIFFTATRISESVTWMKAVMMGFDLLSFWLILKMIALAELPRDRLLLFAWHPLVVWEFAGNGHIDAAMIFFVLLALWARWRQEDGITGMALGLAILIKLYPIIFFPALFRRWNWKMPLAMLTTIVAGYVPFLTVGTKVFGFLPGYLQEEGFINGGRYFLLGVVYRLFPHSEISVSAFMIIAGLILLILGVWATWRMSGPGLKDFTPVLAMAATFTLLISPHYTWYFSWLIPLACLVPFFPILFLTATAFYLDQTPLQDPGGPRWQINLCLYVPFALFSLFLLGRKYLRGPAPAAEEKALEQQ